jgi:hypothetical protein
VLALRRVHLHSPHRIGGGKHTASGRLGSRRGELGREGGPGVQRLWRRLNGRCFTRRDSECRRWNRGRLRPGARAHCGARLRRHGATAWRGGHTTIAAIRGALGGVPRLPGLGWCRRVPREAMRHARHLAGGIVHCAAINRSWSRAPHRVHRQRELQEEGAGECGGNPADNWHGHAMGKPTRDTAR